ncbi:MAG: TlpA family protein disulfide reductase [Bacteroidetes bacterium]|nr:MAG: TlpA family protein disulfide reductase [Bacteroidota bacterium]TAG89356.1 MAG: TlpA family protein disulfide reductase [Bacteroidota bacterium]
MKKIIYLLLIIFVLFSCNSKPTDKGQIAPVFALADMENQTYSPEKNKGKVLILHFWTDFCRSCREEFPRMQANYEELKKDNSFDFELVAINLGQSKKVSEKFKKDFEISFKMLVDEKKITEKLYDIQTFPTNYIINSEGKIARKIKGWLSKKQIEMLIKQNS